MKESICIILALLSFEFSVFSQEKRLFKVMTYNIRNSYAKDGENCWKNRRQATVKMIKEVRPDVV